jgi:hypothetical protein
MVDGVDDADYQHLIGIVIPPSRLFECARASISQRGDLPQASLRLHWRL